MNNKSPAHTIGKAIMPNSNGDEIKTHAEKVDHLKTIVGSSSINDQDFLVCRDIRFVLE
jgi:hypothetical protein